MKVVVQDVSTGQFWKGNGDWLTEIDVAHEFSSCRGAIDICVKQRLRGIRLVLRFGNPESDMYMRPFAFGRGRANKEACIEEMIAINEELAEHQTALQAQLEKKVADIEALQARVKFARKAFPPSDEDDVQRSGRIV